MEWKRDGKRQARIRNTVDKDADAEGTVRWLREKEDMKRKKRKGQIKRS